MHIQKLLAHSMLGRGFYYITVLAVTIFLSRYLQAELAGNFFYTLVILSFIQLLVSITLDSGITYYVAGHSTAHWIKILIPVWSIIAGFAGMVLINYTYNLFHLSKIAMPFLFTLFIFLFITGQCLINFSAAWLQANQSFFIPYAVQAFSNIFFLVISAWLIQYNKGTDQIFLTYFASILFSGLILYLIVLFKKGYKFQKNIKHAYTLKQIFSYSFIALWANIFFFLVYRIDAWFLKQSSACTAADLGNYLQASRLGQMLLILPQIAAAVIFPQVANKKDDKMMVKNIEIICRLLSLFFLFIFIGIAAGGNFFFPLIFGESFTTMTMPLLILLPGIYFLSVHNILAAWIGGSGQVKQNVISAGIALSIAFMAYHFTVPMYGTIAAAAVSSGAYFILMVYSFFIMKKNLNISLWNFIGFKKSDIKWLLNLYAQEYRVHTSEVQIENEING